MTAKEKIKKLAEIISEWIKPLGYQVLDIEKETHNGNILRITIDWLDYESHTSNIGLDDIMKVNQLFANQEDDLLEKAVDQLELMSSNYDLEVSSPGLNRKLQTKQDFTRFQDHQIKCTTRDPVFTDQTKKQNTFIGHLKEHNEEGFHLELKEKKKTQSVFISWKNLLKATLEPEFLFTGEKTCQN
jgi:ribosome maturation factor RimP